MQEDLTIRLSHSESIAKGVLVGLLMAVAVQPPDLAGAVFLYGSIFAGLLVALVVVGWQVARRQERSLRNRFWPFVFYLILEHPGGIYAGVLGGLVIGIASAMFVQVTWQSLFWDWQKLVTGLALGAIAGMAFGYFVRWQNRWLRSGTILTIAGIIVAAFVLTLTWYPEWLPQLAPRWFSIQLLSAAVLVHLLTFAGRTEESELECGLTTMFIAASLWVLLPERWRLIGLLLSLMWYVFYTSTVLPNVQVLKYVLRGWNYLELDRYRNALLAFRRALQIHPDSAWARSGLWQVHRRLTADMLAQQPELRELVDLDLCLFRISELLMQGPPSPGALEEAEKLLNLVLHQDPNRRAEVLYWRAVLQTHAHNYDRAADDLIELLDGTQFPKPCSSRERIIARAWQLALLAHSELTRRVGEPTLQIPGKRVEALADIEQVLRQQPSDPVASEVKQYLYSALTLADWEAARHKCPDAVQQLDYDYILQQGQQLLKTPEQWQRGAEFLHMAALGMPDKAPGIFAHLGQTYQQQGDEEKARYYYEQAKLAAREYGLDRLATEEKQAYFRAVRELAHLAYRHEDLDRAIENFTLYMESPQAGTDTLRIVTELYERKGDALSALLWNEKALSLDSGNSLLLERKDRYYYSISPEELAAQRERIEKYFDAEYCLGKAKSLVDLRNAGEPQLEWALHLARLVLALNPTNIRALVLCGRVYQRVGNDEEAARYYEQARAAKPERFASREEEEAWYLATVRLGDYYLHSAHKPDLALLCYSDYRRSPKSGADTLYKMGQCYEQLGDLVRAAKCYQAVTVYDHPLASDAYAALARLEASGRSPS